MMQARLLPLRFCCVLLFVVAVSRYAGAASVSENLGEALLPAEADDSVDVPTESQPAPPAGLLDEGLLDELFGTDPQRSESPFGRPLRIVLRQMKVAQRRIAERDTSGQASTAQQLALAELDTMIAELAQAKQQCKAAGGGGSQGQQSSSGQNAAGQTPGGAGGTTSSSPTAVAESENVRNLIRDLWGHLPPREREQVLQPLREDFLPEYAERIEAYFRELAEPSESPVGAQ